MPEKIKILKVKFDAVTLTEATEKAVAFANDKRQHQIITPNPEMLLAAMKNPKFLEVLNRSHLNIADGIGILWASRYLAATAKNQSQFIKMAKWIISLSSILFYPPYIRKQLPERVTGVDLMNNICKKTPKEIKVFLLGAAPGTAEIVKEKLSKQCKKLKVVGTHCGTPLPQDEKEILTKINQTKPEILFIAYGAPAQELWISRNLRRIPSVHLAIGVGGAFNFIAGKRHRAPKFMQKLGLEWLYRLIQEPKRIRRIYNATINFPITVLKENLRRS